MKKTRKSLYLIVFAIVVAMASLFAMACGDTNTSSDIKYKLTFMDGTRVYRSYEYEEGADIAAVDDPTRNNYVFVGWSLTENGKVVDLPSKMPGENMTYYAVFSVQYTITLDPGVGSIADAQKTALGKSGDRIYDFVSDVIPSISGDATFAGWFYTNKDKELLIDEKSDAQMPNGNITLKAKYYIDYSLKTYKQVEFDGDVYAEPESKAGRGYIGEIMSDIPVYEGYRYNPSKNNSITTKALSLDKSANVYEAYYDLIGYTVIFNSNQSSDVDVEGEMSSATCGYGILYDVPECAYTVDGYRFEGWATTPNGEAIYRVGNKYSVKRSTTLYAVWVKGLTEITGQSSDRIYILTNSAGTGKDIYLERFALNDDVKGKYDASAGTFTFDGVTEEAGTVVLRGIADTVAGKFAYINVDNATVYKMRDMDGNIVDGKTLKLAADGTAEYIDDENSINGVYSVSEDGSMTFAGGEKEFVFRLGSGAREQDNIPVFSIRGEEFGIWNNLAQSGFIDNTYRMELDGYGNAIMYVSGYSNNLDSRIENSFSGFYNFTKGDGAYVGDSGKEIVVRVFNNSLMYRDFVCLLMTGEYYANGDDVTKYTNVYLENFSAEIYGRPDDGQLSSIDKDVKITLDGYSVLPNSATYTYRDNSGNLQTVRGKYEYDRRAGTLEIATENGDEYLFEIRSITEGDNSENVFEKVSNLFGEYLVNGIESSFYRLYRFQIFNNGYAAFAFLLPVSDSFYGNIAYEYYRSIYGTYKVASRVNNSGDESENPFDWTYEFYAEIDNSTISAMYTMYTYLTGQGINVSQFGSFRFQFVYSDEQPDTILYCRVTDRGDFQGGSKIIYSDEKITEPIELTLDGFGMAESADGTIVKYYSHDTMVGLHRLFVYKEGKPDPQPTDTSKYFVYFDINNTGNYSKFISSYSTYNARNTFIMLVFENNEAVLAANVGSTSLQLSVFSSGTVAYVEGSNSKYGRYERTKAYGGIFAGITEDYSLFDFNIITLKDKDGNDYESLYIIAKSVNRNSDKTVTAADGSTLIIKAVGADGKATAKYTEKGVSDTVYEGEYTVCDDLMVLYYSYQDGEDTIRSSVSLKLEYTGDDVTSFKRVGNEAGRWISYADGNSYVILSGEETDEDGVYGATYYEYDAENEKFIEHTATYKATEIANADGFDLTYETGATDDDGTPVSEQFTFRPIRVSGISIYQTYVMPLNTYVYFFSASMAQPQPIGILQGGGYQAQTLQLGNNTTYTGKFVQSEENPRFWIFTPNNSTQSFYITMLRTADGAIPLLLDATVTAPQYGTFELSEQQKVTRPAVDAFETEDEEGNPIRYEALEAKEVSVTSIEMLGYGLAYLHYDGEAEDQAVNPNARIFGLYMAYSTNTYMYVILDGNSNNESLEVTFRFKLYVSGNEDKAMIVNRDLFGTFKGDNLTVVNLDGFDRAYYVDNHGRVFAGMFECVNADEKVFMITFIDFNEYTVNRVYIVIDQENDTYVTIPSDDSRIPDDTQQP